MFKKLLLLAFAASSQATPVKNYIALRIKAIRNCSEKTVELEQLALPVEAYCKKLYLCKEDVDIPFISIAEYVKEYTQGVHGRAYIPKGSLLIKIGSRNYGFWENEKGIWYSPEPKTGTDEENWPHKLSGNINRRKPKDATQIKSVLKFLLIIDRLGEISLENYENFVATRDNTDAL